MYVDYAVKSTKTMQCFAHKIADMCGSDTLYRGITQCNAFTRFYCQS